MPRPKSTPRLLQRSSPSTGRPLAYAKFDGRTITFGPMGPDARKQFEQTLATWIANGHRLESPATRSKSFTVSELVDAYIAHAGVYYRHQADGKPTASVGRIKRATKFLASELGPMRACDFELQALRSYRDRLIAAGLSRITINGKVQVVKQMFAWGAEQDLVAPEVAARLKVLRQLQRGRSPARDLPPREPVEWTTVQATLPHLPRPVRGIVMLMWHTAMRVGEACQICGRDVDRSGEVWVFRPRRHKLLHHGKTREVDIGKRAQDVLAEFVQLDPEQPWFSPQEAHREHLAARRAARATKLFESHKKHILSKRIADPKRAPGPIYTGRTVAKTIQKAIAKLNRRLADEHAQSGADGPPPSFSPWSTHQLRYSALCRVRTDHGAEAALAIGGHGSFRMTEHYTASSRRQMAREVAAKSG